MKTFLVKYKLAVIGALAGVVGGLAYWYFVGCSTGTCAITSSPFNSSIYFGILGGAVFHTFAKEEKKENNINS